MKGALSVHLSQDPIGMQYTVGGPGEDAEPFLLFCSTPLRTLFGAYSRHYLIVTSVRVMQIARYHL